MISCHINDGKLLKKYKTISTKIEDFKNIKLNALPEYYDRYINTKIRTYGDKVYTTFCGSVAQWRCDYQWTSHLHSTKSELRFCTGPNLACDMSETRDGEDL